jgi:sarcosine oxidase
MKTRYDVAVIGAGAFGAWTAYALHHAGKRVILLDAYGPANSRASSGGESRITRMAYGDDEIYSRWALESLPAWRALEERSNQLLFHNTGVLTFSDEQTQWIQKSATVIQRVGGECEILDNSELQRRFPQVSFKRSEIGIFEPKMGSILARRAIHLLVRELLLDRVPYLAAAVPTPFTPESIQAQVRADQYVFACGPWLPKLFPDILGQYITPIRAEVFFLGHPPGRSDFCQPHMPTWIFMGTENWDAYGIPSIDGRDFKLAVDLIRQSVDPDTMDRQTTAPFIAQMRDFVRERFPLLADASIVETRVCQYENTPTHDYLVDRHPHWSNIWLVGGGSGHGFKNGPAVGRYVADLITKGAPLEEKFRLHAS